MISSYFIIDENLKKNEIREKTSSRSSIINQNTSNFDISVKNYEKQIDLYFSFY